MSQTQLLHRNEPDQAGSSYRRRISSIKRNAGKPLVPTIFHEPWWLEIACDGDCHETTVSNGGMIVGRLPYTTSRKAFGLTALGMPALTHVLGPALAVQHDGQDGAHPLKQIGMIQKLVTQLPRAAHVSFRLHAGLNNTLGFDTAGFSNHASYTVEVPPQAPEAMWRQMRDKTRNVIRRAQEHLNTTEIHDARTFLDFYDDNLRKRGRVNTYYASLCLRLITECIHRGVGRIVATMTPDGDLQSAVFTVWDHQSEYYFMSTRAEGSMNGAVSLAIWTAIQHAAEKGLTFDMDGLHVVGAALPNMQLLTGFGGTVKPRFVVHRTSRTVNTAKTIVDYSIHRARALVRSGKTAAGCQAYGMG